MLLLRRWLLFVAAVLVVAACGAPVAPDPGLSKIEGTVYDWPGEPDPPLVLSVGMYIADDTVFSMSAASFVEIGPGWWAGAFAGVADDDFVLLPPGEEGLPDGVLVPAEDALVNVVGAGCDLDVEPAGVKLSVTALSLLPIPLLVGLTPDGIVFMLTTDGPVVEEDDIDDATLLTWVFADGPVTLTTDDDCSFAVDLSLRQGWNQVGWRGEGPTVYLENAADAELFSAAVLAP